MLIGSGDFLRGLLALFASGMVVILATAAVWELFRWVRTRAFRAFWVFAALWAVSFFGAWIFSLAIATRDGDGVPPVPPDVSLALMAIGWSGAALALGALAFGLSSHGVRSWRRRQGG